MPVEARTAERESSVTPVRCGAVSTSSIGASDVVPDSIVRGDQPCEEPRGRTRQPCRQAQLTTDSTSSASVGAQAHRPSAVISPTQFRYAER